MRTEALAPPERGVKPGVDVSAGEPPRSMTPEIPFLFVHRRVTEDHICVLTFDRPDSSANVFDRATIEELNRHLEFISGSPKLKGVVLTSAKSSIFIAGADLHALAGAPAGDLASLIELGQTVFNRLAALSVPTVAAIHAVCRARWTSSWAARRWPPNWR